MFDSHRTPLPVVLSILFLVALPSAAQGQSYIPPPSADYVTNQSQFLRCVGNPYALCYYSGPDTPPPDNNVYTLNCQVSGDPPTANCQCYAVMDGTTPNFVALWSILNPGVLRETVVTCGVDGENCLNLLTDITTPDGDCPGGIPTGTSPCIEAPVCSYLGDAPGDGTKHTGQTLYPDMADNNYLYISTFSFAKCQDYGNLATTACEQRPYTQYAGCMTAPCLFRAGMDTYATCECPIYEGPFQYGISETPSDCDAGGSPYIWSASNCPSCSAALCPPGQ